MRAVRQGAFTLGGHRRPRLYRPTCLRPQPFILVKISPLEALFSFFSLRRVPKRIHFGQCRIFGAAALGVQRRLD